MSPEKRKKDDVKAKTIKKYNDYFMSIQRKQTIIGGIGGSVGYILSKHVHPFAPFRITLAGLSFVASQMAYEEMERRKFENDKANGIDIKDRLGLTQSEFEVIEH